MLDCLTGPPCIPRVGISNYIPQYSVECNYLSLPDIPASGSKVLIWWYNVSFSVSDLLDIRLPVLIMYSKYVSDIQLEHLPKKNVIISTLCRNRADWQPFVRLRPSLACIDVEVTKLSRNGDRKLMPSVQKYQGTAIDLYIYVLCQRQSTESLNINTYKCIRHVYSVLALYAYEMIPTLFRVHVFVSPLSMIPSL